MASSAVEICNLSLGILEEQRIMSLTDSSEPARLCHLHYGESRDFVLRLHPWNFAVRRAVLAENAEAPEFGYSRSFKLPTDPYCLRVLSVNDPAAPPDWKIEGRDLLTDEAVVRLTYVARVLDATTYDTGFVQALSHFLAWKLAKPLTGSRSEAEMRREEFFAILRTARGIDGMEDVQDPLPTSPFVIEQVS